MRLIVGLSLSAGVAISALAQGAEASTLCKADETVVFSCSTGAHMASLCASKDLSASQGYLQYRFGKNDDPEFVYPAELKHPTGLFAPGMLMFSGGGGAYLQFSNGAYGYTIFSAVGKWGANGGSADASGVAVAKDGKEFANFPCHGEAAGELGPDFFEKSGLKMPDAAGDFDIPQAFLPK